MGRAARRRKLRAQNGANGERAGAGPGPGLSNAYRAILGGLAFGTTLAVAVVIVGLVFLFQESGAGVPAQGAAHDPVEPSGPAQAAIEVEARHLGNLQVELAATVTMNDSRRELTQADVVAYTDMVEMPGGHTQGPIVLTEAPGQPGRYVAETEVPMVGDYEVHVEVRSPVQGDAHATVTVGTLAP